MLAAMARLRKMWSQHGMVPRLLPLRRVSCCRLGQILHHLHRFVITLNTAQGPVAGRGVNSVSKGDSHSPVLSSCSTSSLSHAPTPDAAHENCPTSHHGLQWTPVFVALWTRRFVSRQDHTRWAFQTRKGPLPSIHRPVLPFRSSSQLRSPSQTT